MALQTSGAISINDIHVEAGGSSGTSCTINDSDIRGLIGKGSATQMSFSEWYGASAETELTSGTTINGQSNRQEITASTYISSGGTLVIPSGFWVWSDSTSTAALTIDISCTIKNNGKIIGKGGNGRWGRGGAGLAGGPAIKINSGVSGVTIINNSGAYIAGGGGGGGGFESGGLYAGGGGGAGGGQGSKGRSSASDSWNTAGGVLNAVGASGGYSVGGGAGGEGGQRHAVYNSTQQGAGGGRILPGVGGSGGGTGGDGGSAGNAGSYHAYTGGGGGGGWGANGGTGYYNSTVAGGAGGKAIDDSGVSYTLTQNGTVYGGT